VSAGAQEIFLLVLLLLLAVVATVASLTRDPRAQALVLSAYAMVMGVLMVAFHAPDVAMSELAIGSAVVPLLLVLAIRTCDREARAVQERKNGHDR
jgi:uncharacterized MnhB-related membrane protein